MAANTELFNPLVPKLTIVIVKIYRFISKVSQ